MSTEIQQYQPQGSALAASRSLTVWAEEARAASVLATGLCSTSFVPQAFRDKPAEATAAILAGSEVGLSPMAALNAYDVIQGRPAPKAITLRAIAQSHGHRIWPVSMTPAECVMRGQRAGDPEPVEVKWTIKRANDMGLTNKPNWKNQPQAMLVARATSEVARLIAADVLLGIPYSAEELEDETPAPAVKVSRAKAAKPATPEPEFDEPAAQAEPEEHVPDPFTEQAADTKPAEPMTAKTRAHLFALFGERGINDRDEQIRGMVAIIGRPIESRADLTEDEAQQVLTRLKGGK